MITNDRQYKITKAQLEKFESALRQYSLETAIESGTHPAIAQAEYDQIESEYQQLSFQIKEYNELQSGTQRHFDADSLADLPLMLIKARIARGWTQKDLADALGAKEQQIQRYEAEQYNTARLKTLLNIADTLGLQVSEDACLLPSDDSGNDFVERYPIAEMYKRGWFADFSGTLREAKKNAGKLIEGLFREANMTQDLAALHRKKVRSGGSVDEYALTAWKLRVIAQSNKQKLAREFERDRMSDEWFRELAKLSQYANGPLMAKEWLGQIGICLVIEPHLPRTHLDGAAIKRPDGAPVVALTLRNDRIDNFWFVLFHELAHVRLHLYSSDSFEFFDDVDSPGNELEEEADQFALDRLIPRELWNRCLSRFSLDIDMVHDEAHQIEVNPAILAGRIRYEKQNFQILNDALGIGQVRGIFDDDNDWLF